MARRRDVGHRWRDYRTPTGRRPVKKFLDSLSDEDAAEVIAAMAEVRDEGLQVARHLRREIYEVRADGRNATFRVLFAPEGKKGRILLALEAFSKTTRKTPPRLVELAERRLAEWRTRGRHGS
ncbi:MAG: type II toxin-antitoxin system RelE/ParE family toxin [Gaiellaceae bacterium]